MFLKITHNGQTFKTKSKKMSKEEALIEFSELMDRLKIGNSPEVFETGSGYLIVPLDTFKACIIEMVIEYSDLA